MNLPKARIMAGIELAGNRPGEMTRSFESMSSVYSIGS